MHILNPNKVNKYIFNEPLRKAAEKFQNTFRNEYLLRVEHGIYNQCEEVIIAVFRIAITFIDVPSVFEGFSVKCYFDETIDIDFINPLLRKNKGFNC